jgi:hypothetical protein
MLTESRTVSGQGVCKIFTEGQRSGERLHMGCSYTESVLVGWESSRAESRRRAMTGLALGVCNGRLQFSPWALRA